MPSTPSYGPAGRVRAPVRWAILLVAAAGFLAIGLHQASRDAPTIDEGIDVSSGISHLVQRDLRMTPEHPPLPKVVAALPALLAHPIVPETEAWEQGAWFDWSDDFISANAEAGRLDDVLLYSRAVVLVEVLVCAGLLYLLADRWFGPDGATLVAVAWLATPYVVGIGHFAMIDVWFVAVTLATALALARWRDHPTMGRTVALGAALAAALASRHTGIVLVALVAAVVLVHRRDTPREAARDLGVLALTSVLGLWLVYRGLAPSGSSAAVEGSFEGLIAQGGDGSILVRLVGALPLPLEWRAGFAYLDLTSTARPASLLGQSWDGGRWWFFPVSALLKLPLPLTAAIVAGWALASRRARARRDLLVVAVVPALLLWLFLVAQPLNLGLRLALPTVALAYLGLGGLALVDGSARRVANGGALAVVTLLVVTSIVAVPHSLAWTPPPFVPAYRWVSDSSLDAGQALYEVRAWAAEHDQPYVALDRTRGLEVEGGSRALRDVAPEEVRGWVAVGVTPLMQTRRDEGVWSGEEPPPPGFSLAWLRKYCPVDELGGGSVLVYRFVDAPDPSPGPERPVEPCWGAETSTAQDG